MKLGKCYAEEAFLFTLTNIDRKHDLCINQEVFPAKE